MIVRNEEKVIERCLNSVIGIFDEIIIVDTGSSDKTKALCRKFTDKVYDFEWIDDFSAARNYAFKMASSEYLFWLDADDVIEEKDAAKITELKKTLWGYDTYMLKYVAAENSAGESIFEFYRERIVRNCINARFRGFVHECICPFGRITYEDISVRHRKVGVSDPERNLNIYLKKQKDGVPFDARNVYYFAKEYFYLGRYEECAAKLKKFLVQKNKNIADVKDALITLYKCDGQKGIGSPDYLFAVLKEVGGDAETLTLLGDYYRSIKDTVKAELYYKFALCVDEKNAVGFVNKSYYYLYPILDLVSLYYENGEMEKAADFHKLSAKKYPTDERVIANARFFK